MKHLASLFVIILYLPVTQAQSWLDSLQPRVVFSDSISTYNLEDAMEKYHVQAASVLILEDDIIRDYRAFSRSENGLESLDIDTRFQAGSISKPLAAYGILLCAQQFGWDLDASVNDYLKNWKITSDSLDGNAVTIRSLLSHTAGLNVHGFPGYESTDGLPTTEDIVNGKGNTEKVELIMSPGGQWSYSGGGFEILQLLVEEMTGKSFAAYMDSEILGPIGMKKSTYQILKKEDCPSCVEIYDRAGKKYAVPWMHHPESAAAGLWTTPGDLAVFLTYLRKSQTSQMGLLKGSYLKEMLQPVMDNYGLGWFVELREDQKIIGHSGKNMGFTNEMNYNISNGNACIVMTNSDGAFQLITELTASQKVENWNIPPQVVISRKPADKKTLKKYAGKYVFTDPGGGKHLAKIEVSGDELRCTDVESQRTFRLVHVGELQFVAFENGVKAQFMKKGKKRSMLWDQRIEFVK